MPTDAEVLIERVQELSEEVERLPDPHSGHWPRS